MLIFVVIRLTAAGCGWVSLYGEEFENMEDEE